MPPHDGLVDSGPCGDIHRRDAIRVVGGPTADAFEGGLRLAVAFIDTTAERTGLRGMCRIEENDRHTRKTCFVEHEGAKLVVGPSLVEMSPFPSNRRPPPDPFEVFEDQNGSCLTGFLHKTLGDGVVQSLCKIPFLAGSKNPIVVDDRTTFLEDTLFFPISLVGVHDLRDGVNCQLSRKTKTISDLLIDHSVERNPTESSGLEGNTRDEVAGGVDRLKERSPLLRGRAVLELNRELHVFLACQHIERFVL